MVSISIQLDAPSDDLSSLSFCDVDAAALEEWSAELPLANTNDTAAQLHRAVTEVSRLAVDPEVRFELLEILRTLVHYISTRLDRSVLGAPHDGEGYAQLAQQLQAGIAAGYKATIRDAASDSNDPARLDLIGHATHRAISDCSRTLLRAIQIHTSTPPGIWAELNQLYRLAERLGFGQSSWSDDENHESVELSVQDAYLRIALLATCRPNQLRHTHLNATFNVLELWTPRVTLDLPTDDDLFRVDLDLDAPPIYREIAADSGELRGIRTDVLVYELEAYLNEIACDIPVPDYMEEGLLRHLVTAWSMMRKRTFRRRPVAGAMKICTGMRSVHFHLSGGVPFESQIASAEAMPRPELNPFLDDLPRLVAENAWDEAFDLHGEKFPENPNIEHPERILDAPEIPEDAALRQNYSSVDAVVVDTSPAGFQVKLTSAVDKRLYAGELLALRESSDARWCVAVARWLRYSDDETLMGLELLSPRAIPVAIRVVRKRGGIREHARGLLLPEMPIIGQPATLLTPRIPFDESHKVQIQRQGIQTKAQLMRRVRNTESFSQFTFRMLDGYLENAQFDLNMGSYWEALGDAESDLPR
jgi:hypothetical protein